MVKMTCASLCFDLEGLMLHQFFAFRQALPEPPQKTYLFRVPYSDIQVISGSSKPCHTRNPKL